jgi:hypothetical protein
MYFFIYKTKHVNGKYYIGRHKTVNLNDGYLGSGLWVASISDKSSLVREYIEFTDTYEKLVILEEYYISVHFNDPLCMNWTKSSNGFTSEDARRINRQLVSEGRHHLLRRPDGTSVTSDRVKNGTNSWLKRSDGTSVTSERVKNGTHNFLKRPDGTSLQTDRVSNGTHHLLGANKGIDNPRFSEKTYEFVNDDGRIEKNVTQFYMKTKYKDLSSSKISLLVNGKRKTHKGWKIKDNYSE